jgi:hypothetical protein
MLYTILWIALYFVAAPLVDDAFASVKFDRAGAWIGAVLMALGTVYLLQAIR